MLILIFFFGHSKSCVPLFVQLKQPSIFPPQLFLFSTKKSCTDAVESHAEDNIASLLLFSPKRNLSIFANYFFFHFFYLLSSPVTLQKSPNNHFFNKVSTVLFFLFHLFFLLFLGLKAILLFDFFSSGFGKRQTVESGEDLIGSFLPCDTELESCGCRQLFFFGSCDTTLLIPLVDFLGVFCSFHKLKQWLVAFLLAQANILNFVF